MEYLLLWVVDESSLSEDPEERMKRMMSDLESVKKNIGDGSLKKWGMSPGGGHGYAIFEGDGKQMFAICSQYMPHVQFEVQPMISVDEVIDTAKAMRP